MSSYSGVKISWIFYFQSLSCRQSLLLKRALFLTWPWFFFLKWLRRKIVFTYQSCMCKQDITGCTQRVTIKIESKLKSLREVLWIGIEDLDEWVGNVRYGDSWMASVFKDCDWIIRSRGKPCDWFIKLEESHLRAKIPNVCNSWGIWSYKSGYYKK